jgi:hypothetical protein
MPKLHKKEAKLPNNSNKTKMIAETTGLPNSELVLNPSTPPSMIIFKNLKTASPHLLKPSNPTDSILPLSVPSSMP